MQAPWEGTPANVLLGGGGKTISTIEKNNDRLVKFAVSRLTPRRVAIVYISACAL